MKRRPVCLLLPVHHRNDRICSPPSGCHKDISLSNRDRLTITISKGNNLIRRCDIILVRQHYRISFHIDHRIFLKFRIKCDHTQIHTQLCSKLLIELQRCCNTSKYMLHVERRDKQIKTCLVITIQSARCDRLNLNHIVICACMIDCRSQLCVCSRRQSVSL